MNIFTEAAKLEEQNCPFAMAQIVDSRGSTPRHSAQMLVRRWFYRRYNWWRNG
mgnify:CR=1 FL=1